MSSLDGPKMVRHHFFNPNAPRGQRVTSKLVEVSKSSTTAGRNTPSSGGDQVRKAQLSSSDKSYLGGFVEQKDYRRERSRILREKQARLDKSSGSGSGRGRGNWGHAGRPGMVGGSA